MTEPKITKTHRWPVELIREVEEFAKAHGRYVQGVLDECVRIGLDAMKAKEGSENGDA